MARSQNVRGSYSRCFLYSPSVDNRGVRQWKLNSGSPARFGDGTQKPE